MILYTTHISNGGNTDETESDSEDSDSIAQLHRYNDASIYYPLFANQMTTFLGYIYRACG